MARQSQRREPAKQILYLWMKSLFVNYVLAGERLDMAHGVEVRLPFLDHKLFEFARSIPSSMLARDGRQKYVLREAVKPFVTDEVYHGAKQPFFAPPTTVQVGNPMYELLQDTLRSQGFHRGPFSTAFGISCRRSYKYGDSRKAMDRSLMMESSPFLTPVRSLSW